jgi:hypothetical protein
MIFRVAYFFLRDRDEEKNMTKLTPGRPKSIFCRIPLGNIPHLHMLISIVIVNEVSNEWKNVNWPFRLDQNEPGRASLFFLSSQIWLRQPCRKLLLAFADLYHKTFYGSNCCRILISYSIWCSHLL